MIPNLITLPGSPWQILPPGHHQANFEEVAIRYATNSRRRELFDGLIIAALNLRAAGCTEIYLDGSFVTNKPKPGDYDACFNTAGVNGASLDPVFRDFSNGRAAQKLKFKGEFFPSSASEGGSGRTFLDFFQNDRFTGQSKGILVVPLRNDPTLLRSIQ